MAKARSYDARRAITWAGYCAIIAICSLAMIFHASLAYAQTSEELGYKTVEGTLQDDELGFSLELPDSMEGFVSEFDSGGRRVLTMQIHPEFDSSSAACCPTIDAAPAVFLLTSDLLDTASTPVPLTGDVYAAIQGYDMRMSIEELGGMQVLAATIYSDNDRFGLDYDNAGKFYFINSDERYLSYGLWASEENYDNYLEAFEESARSLVIENAQPVNLHSIFRHYTYSGIEVQQEDGPVLYPEIISPSTIESVAIDNDSSTVTITVDESSDTSFLILNSGDLLAGPHSATSDGEPVESTALSNENGEYLVVYYNEPGRHEIAITGTAVVPEFGSIAVMLMAAGIVGIVAVTKYMHKN